MSVTAEDDDAREEFLRAYVTTYLGEEVRAEGLVRNLGGFSRFLEVVLPVEVFLRRLHDGQILG